MSAPKKLLIVDDSKVSRMVIRARVKQLHPDWDIIEATHGEESIALAQQHCPDFCTMDINMPGMPGTQAAEQILKTVPHIRLVIFTANIQSSFRERASALGVAFVAKPVTEKSIFETLAYFQE